MKYDIAVGTYHKTGTVWMRKTLETLANRLGLPLFRMSRHQVRWKTEADLKALYARHLAGLRAGGRHGFFFDSHSMFPAEFGNTRSSPPLGQARRHSLSVFTTIGVSGIVRCPASDLGIPSAL